MVLKIFFVPRKTKLKNELQLNISEGFINVGNLAFGSLIFGQFINKENYNLPLAIGGLFSWILFYSLAVGIILLDITLFKKGRPK